ncbi:MAG: SUKH-3 domain-containing protein [Chthonomonadales bacterium]
MDRTERIEFHWMDFDDAPIENIEIVNSKVGADICYVGKRDSDDAMIAICRDGRMIGDWERDVWLFGQTSEEGLVNIVHENTATVWYSDRDQAYGLVP